MTQPARTRIKLLVTKSPDEAEDWAAALDEAGIDVLIELTDRHMVQPGSWLPVGALGAAPMDFVHAITVWPEDRERALAVLVDDGWDGRTGRTWMRRTGGGFSELWKPALFTLGGVALFLIVRASFS